MTLTIARPTISGSDDRRPLTGKEQGAAVLFGLWMILGLFLDGWAHDNSKPETFFTPWHGVLYSGFLGAGAFALGIAVRSHDGRRPWRATLPAGHGLTLAALGAFAVGAVGDLIWHEAFGIEVGLEALLSPTHLALLAAGLVALSAPVRATWMVDGPAPRDLRSFLPTVLAMALLVALVGFFLLYLSPFLNDAAGSRFVRVPGVPHDHPSRDVGELQQLLGVASILMTTVLLVVPVSLLLRRWRPPAGTLTVLVGVVVLLFVGLNEFSQWPLAVTGIVAGAAGDAVVRRSAPWVAAADHRGPLAVVLRDLPGHRGGRRLVGGAVGRHGLPRRPGRDRGQFADGDTSRGRAPRHQPGLTTGTRRDGIRCRTPRRPRAPRPPSGRRARPWPGWPT